MNAPYTAAPKGAACPAFWRACQSLHQFDAAPVRYSSNEVVPQVPIGMKAKWWLNQFPLSHVRSRELGRLIQFGNGKPTGRVGSARAY